MKYEKIETPRTLIRQRENVIDVLEHWPEEGCKHLDLDEWVSSCGTYRCLFGDFLFRRGGSELLNRFRRSTQNRHSNGPAHIKAAFGDMGYLPSMSEFGGWVSVFGAVVESGTLDQRKANLQIHLETLDTRIAQWYVERECGVMA